MIFMPFFAMTQQPIVPTRWAQNNNRDNVYIEENIDWILKNDKY
jgi:hypothetical protein